MLKKYTLPLLLIIPAQAEVNKDTAWKALAAAGTVATGLLASKLWSKSIIRPARAQFRNRAQNGFLHINLQNDTPVQNQTTQLNRYISAFHNAQRDRWSLPVLYDLYLANNPAIWVRNEYHNYSHLQLKHDLNWYLNRLKIVRYFNFFGLLERNHTELNTLIDDLEDLKRILNATTTLNGQEASYEQQEQLDQCLTNARFVSLQHRMRHQANNG